jgi:hypothetical protein
LFNSQQNHNISLEVKKLDLVTTIKKLKYTNNYYIIILLYLYMRKPQIRKYGVQTSTVHVSVLGTYPVRVPFYKYEVPMLKRV